jgi:hypothetical protein
VFGRSGEHLLASLRKLGLVAAPTTTNDRQKVVLTRPLANSKKKKAAAGN